MCLLFIIYWEKALLKNIVLHYCLIFNHDFLLYSSTCIWSFQLYLASGFHPVIDHGTVFVRLLHSQPISAHLIQLLLILKLMHKLVSWVVWTLILAFLALPRIHVYFSHRPFRKRIESVWSWLWRVVSDEIKIIKNSLQLFFELHSHLYSVLAVMIP